MFVLFIFKAPKRSPGFIDIFSQRLCYYSILKAFNRLYFCITKRCYYYFYKLHDLINIYQIMASFSTRYDQERVWTPNDDIKLLDGIVQHGFGNWREISRLIGKDSNECEERYIQRFVDDPPEEELKQVVQGWKEENKTKQICMNNCSLRFSQKPDVTDYSKILKAEKHLRSMSNDAKRHNTIKRRFVNGCIPLPGFNPLRSDFEVEYDDGAELILNTVCQPIELEPVTVQDPNKELIDELSLTLGHIYNFRLGERLKRKKLVRDHGLIDKRKTFNMIQKYETPVAGRDLSSLLFLQRFMSGPEFDYLYESLVYQYELKIKIQSYINYRLIGIRFLSGIKNYENSNKKRLKYKAELRHNRVSIQVDDRPTKRVTNPLVLHNLPGYDLLDEGEKDLCSSARIIPETYHNFKKLLIAECKKNNGLRLVQARPLVKIDVNKTRKLYDYLIAKKLIWKPA